MIGLAGSRSTIAQRFRDLLPDEQFHPDRLADMPLDLDRYLVCTGFLAGKGLAEITPEEAQLTWRKNFLEPASFCDRVFAANPRARVCLIGSESGFAGSYDMAYAGAKAALHLYVERKRLGWPDQQLVCIAPCVIWDSAMTQRRLDLDQLKARAKLNGRGRWLEAREVAMVAKQALCDASPFLSNTIIRLGVTAR